MTLMERFLSQHVPNYDVERYYFQCGDFVQTTDGAVVLVDTGGFKAVNGFVVRRSIKYRNYGKVEVPYEDLPYVKKGEFVSERYKVSKKIKWNVGDIILTQDNFTVYLYEEVEHQRFYGWVIDTPTQYYMHTGIYLINPYEGHVPFDNKRWKEG